MTRSRGHFTDEFKREAVRLARLLHRGSRALSRHQRQSAAQVDSPCHQEPLPHALPVII